MTPPLRLGTRGSRLALRQAEWVRDALARRGVTVETVVITTQGDAEVDRPLHQLEGTGFFTKEIEAALLDGRIDVAVHSLKDLPTRLPDGLALGAVPPRAEPAEVLVARDPDAIAQAGELFQRLIAKHAPTHSFAAEVDPNLLDIVVSAAARAADEKRFEGLRQSAATELDPAAKRRYLHALAAVENPHLVPRAVDLALDEFVPMQDFSSYLGALLANRAAREAAWQLVQTRWDAVRKKADSPMILRRLVEALGSLPTLSHLNAVEKFLAEHELQPARQAVAQTLERMRMDVALRERLLPEIAAWLRKS